jgi:hypothetical protein
MKTWDVVKMTNAGFLQEVIALVLAKTSRQFMELSFSVTCSPQAATKLRSRVHGSSPHWHVFLVHTTPLMLHSHLYLNSSHYIFCYTPRFPRAFYMYWDICCRSSRWRGIAQIRRDLIVPSVGILRGSIPAPAFTLPIRLQETRFTDFFLWFIAGKRVM